MEPAKCCPPCPFSQNLHILVVHAYLFCKTRPTCRLLACFAADLTAADSLQDMRSKYLATYTPHMQLKPHCKGNRRKTMTFLVTAYMSWPSFCYTASIALHIDQLNVKHEGCVRGYDTLDATAAIRHLRPCTNRRGWSISSPSIACLPAPHPVIKSTSSAKLLALDTRWHETRE